MFYILKYVLELRTLRKDTKAPSKHEEAGWIEGQGIFHPELRLTGSNRRGSQPKSGGGGAKGPNFKASKQGFQGPARYRLRRHSSISAITMFCSKTCRNVCLQVAREAG